VDDCDRRELAASYAIGALDDADHAAFEDHLAGCPECARELDAVRDTLLVFAHAGGATPPPPALRERVLAAVAQEARPQSKPRPARRRRWTLTLVPAFAVAAAAAIALVLVTGSSTPGPLRGLGHYSTVALRGAGGQRAGTVYIGLTGKTVVRASLPSPPAGKVYEAWVMVGGHASNAEPAGLFAGGTQYVALSKIAHPGDVVGFTLEPAGGSPHPTTQPLATARV
jgi:anti-sigma-K factor RskA